MNDEDPKECWACHKLQHVSDNGLCSECKGAMNDEELRKQLMHANEWCVAWSWFSPSGGSDKPCPHKEPVHDLINSALDKMMAVTRPQGRQLVSARDQEELEWILGLVLLLGSNASVEIDEYVLKRHGVLNMRLNQGEEETL